MEADVILESPERRIILDTKFYRDTLFRRSHGGWGKKCVNVGGRDPVR